ncbi:MULTISPECIES: hypothetical protein [unclassified Rhizobium]|uniref:hypothetical protein n=1 Tax=unclassified Rhizobium TaxID=2613769 RepID=UPI001ADB9DF0|nr:MULTISPECIES: hypothetical protein [unclassified Rhizobium]MBO9099474.1 hypothetical protein [Rhizobium sp. L58/93]QXZ87043.1 hypothetical protein J5287_20860 [Rhizobium sp. K1/93]QXZ92923.1 hypothetical protein J5280_20035 [Rhizobium sp. K15/93]
MNKIEADLAAINARAAPILAEQARLIKALNAGISLIITLAAVGIFFAVAEHQLAEQAKINQEITWRR